MKKIGIIFGMETTFRRPWWRRSTRWARLMFRRSLPRSAKFAWQSRLPTTSSWTASRTTSRFIAAFLKNAVLSGTEVINNPFWWSADDKFFNFALAVKLGVAVPQTVLLPHKEHPPGDDRAVDAEPGVSDALGRDF